MYQNYIFDLYGTLVDIHTDEEKLELWEKLSLFLAMKGVRYEPEELKGRYAALIEAEQRRLRDEASVPNQTNMPDAPHGPNTSDLADAPEVTCVSSVPELDISTVFSQFFTDKNRTVSDAEIADLAKIFRCLSMERFGLFEGVTELMQTLKAAGKGIYLLSNAQALFTRPELSLLGLEPWFDGILLSSEAGVKKPDPAFFRALFEKCHIDPGESVMVGNDDVADCHGAAGVGMDSLYLCTAQSPKRTRPLPQNGREIPDIGAVSGYIRLK